jgi:hypothetical protein
MLLTRLIKNVFSHDGQPPAIAETAAEGPCVLNVGGGSKQIPIPSHYAGWTHRLLDIAAGPDVDVALDARQLSTLDPEQFDAVYCSHNLEHYYPHDVPKVLGGFLHVLKPEGYAEIRVPDLTSVLATVVKNRMELDDVLYTSSAGPISAHDVIYGWGKEIERSGVEFYAHKRGFSAKSLTAALEQAGFAKIWTLVSEAGFEIRALAFKSEPTAAQRSAFGLGSAS